MLEKSTTLTHKFSHWSSRVNYSIKTIIPNKSLLTYNRFGYDNNMRTPNTPSFSKISQKRNSLKCLSETHLLQVRYNFNFVEIEREGMMIVQMNNFDQIKTRSKCRQRPKLGCIFLLTSSAKIPFNPLQWSLINQLRPSNWQLCILQQSAKSEGFAITTTKYRSQYYFVKNQYMHS